MKAMIFAHSEPEISPGQKILKHNDYQIVVNAGNIIAASKNRASAIEQKSRKEFKKEKQRGFEEGMMESRIQQSEQMLKMVGRTINYLAEVENTMAEILMTAVKKIVEGFDDKKLVEGLIKGALQHVRNEHQVTVRVPPSQLKHVKEQISDILANYKGIGFITPISDPRLSKGSCILESKIGVIDASIDVQMEALKRRFAKLSEETMSAISKSAGNEGG